MRYWLLGTRKCATLIARSEVGPLADLSANSGECTPEDGLDASLGALKPTCEKIRAVGDRNAMLERIPVEPVATCRTADPLWGQKPNLLPCTGVELIDGR